MKSFERSASCICPRPTLSSIGRNCLYAQYATYAKKVGSHSSTDRMVLAKITYSMGVLTFMTV